MSHHNLPYCNSSGCTKDSSRFGIGFDATPSSIAKHHQQSAPHKTTTPSSISAYTCYDIPSSHAYAGIDDPDDDNDTPPGLIEADSDDEDYYQPPPPPKPTDTVHNDPWTTAYSKKGKRATQSQIRYLTLFTQSYWSPRSYYLAQVISELA